jgi:hypothetical protein
MATRQKLIHSGKKLSDLSATTSAELAGVISDETGSGSLVFATSPTLVTPALGTPASGTLTNCTGLPEAGLLDNAVTLAKMAHGTEGNLITYDADGAPAYVATGNATQVLTSNGAGAAPTFQDASGGGANTALSNLASVEINTSLISDTDNTDDLGSSEKEWKDLYIDGTAYIDTIEIASGETITGDGTDLTIASGAKINLNATSDVNIPANVGITFGDDGEKIEGDGTNLTISSSGTLSLNSTGVITASNQGIADNAVVTVDDADAADNDYAKFTANGLEGRSYAEVKQDLDLEVGTDVAAVNQAMHIGTTEVAINRGSAALTLAGITLTTPNIGTPSAGTLTNCTGLPLTGLVDDTSTALGVGSIELGHASDTTLSRPGAGRMQIEGKEVATLDNVLTFTNKRITARVWSAASDATPDVNSDDYDAVTITALEAAITDVNVTGTPTNFQKLIFRIKDNGTARAIAWGSDFEAKGVALPTTTVISKVLTVGFIYDTVTSKWGCVCSVVEA